MKLLDVLSVDVILRMVVHWRNDEVLGDLMVLLVRSVVKTHPELRYSNHIAVLDITDMAPSMAPPVSLPMNSVDILADLKNRIVVTDMTAGMASSGCLPMKPIGMLAELMNSAHTIVTGMAVRTATSAFRLIDSVGMLAV